MTDKSTIDTLLANNKLRPIGDRIVVFPHEPPKATKSGLTLVSNDKDKTTEGTVIAVGSGAVLQDGTRVRPGVEPGQKVVFPLYIGTEIEVDRTIFRVMREEDILAVFGPE